MLQRFQKTDIDKVKSQYQSDALYKAIEASCNHLVMELPTLAVSPEEVFNSTTTILDDFKEKPHDYYTQQIPQLLRTIYADYRRLDGPQDEKEVKSLATILVGIAMQLLSFSDSPFYGIVAKNALMDCFVENSQYFDIGPLNPVLLRLVTFQPDLDQWICEYMESDTYISDDINAFLHPKKKKKKSRENPQQVYHTLKYNCSGELRTKRLQLVLVKLEEWGWIEKPLRPEDFFDFFEGKSRFCNLHWSGKSNATLTNLLQELFNTGYIEKDGAGCSVSSIMRSQFNSEPDYNSPRHKAEDELKILFLTKLILNPKYPLIRIESANDFDLDNALKELQGSDYHIIRDLNKKDL